MDFDHTMKCAQDEAAYRVTITAYSMCAFSRWKGQVDPKC
jgi:hypothetical protein